MNKIIIALGVALVSATSAFAQSNTFDINDLPEFSAAAVDYAATGSVGSVASGNALRYGDTSPMNIESNVDGAATGSIGGASLDARHLGGNS